MAGTASSSQPGGGSVWNRSEMIKAEIEECLGRFAKGCAKKMPGFAGEITTFFHNFPVSLWFPYGITQRFWPSEVVWTVKMSARFNGSGWVGGFRDESYARSLQQGCSNSLYI